jgi:peptide/nickel transport system permease protein
MLRYTLKRLLMMIPVVIAVSFLVFFILYFSPGEPARMILGDNASQQEVQKFNSKYDLDKPLLVQYGIYMKNIVLKGDFGVSYRSGKSVTNEILSRFPVTFFIVLFVTIIASVIGLLLGTFAALHRNFWQDRLTQIISVIGVSIPEFWLALMLILLFSVKLRLLPVSGYSGIRYLILPALTVGLICSASTTRITRSSVLDYLDQDFVRTAKAKGQKKSVIVWKHVMRNALIPILTNAGQQFSSVLAGTMICETVFAIPGLGKLLKDALAYRDYPQIRGAVILLAIAVSVINLLVDLAYALVDPRVKENFKNSSARKRKVA